jgi:hypothetical protein
MDAKIGRRARDVSASIAVVILGKLQVARRHELRLSHGASPRALMFASSISPRLRISGALKFTTKERRPPRLPPASRGGIVGLTPLNRPKLDSTPQMARIIRAGAVISGDVLERCRWRA